MPSYIGVNGKAKTIAKVYKGNSSGKAELIFGPKGIVRSSKEIENATRSHDSCSTVKDNAIFVSGNTIADTYDATLTKSTITPLSDDRTQTTAESMVNYALFAGGCRYGDNGFIWSAAVDSYNKSLTKQHPADLRVKRMSMGSVYNGRYAIFAGGYTSMSTFSSNIDAYGPTLSRVSVAALYLSKGDVASSTAGDYFLFAGGRNASKTDNSVDMYNSDLTKMKTVRMNDSRAACGSGHAGKHAIFAGGYKDDASGYSSLATAEAYNSNLIKIAVNNLNTARAGIASETIGNYLILAGGDNNTDIDIYDSELTKTVMNFSTTASELLSTTVGKFALFGCGTQDKNDSSEMSAYYLWE